MNSVFSNNQKTLVIRSAKISKQTHLIATPGISSLKIRYRIDRNLKIKLLMRIKITNNQWEILTTLKTLLVPLRKCSKSLNTPMLWEIIFFQSASINQHVWSIWRRNSSKKLKCKEFHRRLPVSADKKLNKTKHKKLLQ